MYGKNKYSRLYIKYIVKNPIIFYSFLAAGIALFLYMTLNLKLEITHSFDTEINGNEVSFDCGYEYISDTIYLYKDRNEKIYKLKFTKAIAQSGKPVLIIDNPDKISGSYKAELIIGEQTFLEKIFVKAGKA